jgi:hypothetical protein
MMSLFSLRQVSATLSYSLNWTLLYYFNISDMDGQLKQSTDIKWYDLFHRQYNINNFRVNNGTATKLSCMMKYYIELPTKLGNKIKLQISKSLYVNNMYFLTIIR